MINIANLRKDLLAIDGMSEILEDLMKIQAKSVLSKFSISFLAVSGEYVSKLNVNKMKLTFLRPESCLKGMRCY